MTAWRPGDEVLGVTNPQFVGAHAEHALASAAMIARRPERLDPVAAAGVPVVAVTAWQALFRHAGLTKGQTVLIHGAAGSVGGYAVQLARRAGLRVIATAGAADLAYVRGLGADEAIDYRAVRFEDQVRGVEAVIDLVGGVIQARSLDVLRPGGVLVSAVSQPDAAAASRRQVRTSFFLVEVNTEDLSRLAALIEAGALTTRPGTVLPLAEARAAHEMLEGTRPRPPGKIVLRPGG